MKDSLNDGDGRAVDLFLDRQSSPGAAAKALANGFHERLRAVELILTTLSAHPAPEPPANLLAKTLDFIDEATAISPGSPRSRSPSSRNRRDDETRTRV